MCGSLRHVPAVAGRAHPRRLHEKATTNVRVHCVQRAGEPEAEQPAREIPAELLLDVARDGLLAGRAILELALEALRVFPGSIRVFRGWRRLLPEARGVSRGELTMSY